MTAKRARSYLRPFTNTAPPGRTAPGRGPLCCTSCSRPYRPPKHHYTRHLPKARILQLPSSMVPAAHPGSPAPPVHLSWGTRRKQTLSVHSECGTPCCEAPSRTPLQSPAPLGPVAWVRGLQCSPSDPGLRSIRTVPAPKSTVSTFPFSIPVPTNTSLARVATA